MKGKTAVLPPSLTGALLSGVLLRRGCFREGAASSVFAFFAFLGFFAFLAFFTGAFFAGASVPAAAWSVPAAGFSCAKPTTEETKGY